jgi:serine/threonine protein kinase
VTSKRHDETFQLGLRSFLNEARLLAQFDHPALVKVYRFWEANSTAYMVMPYYEGATLKQALQRDGPPDEAKLKALLAQMLDVLDVLHRVDCLHRDIAPDNILLLPGDKPVLLDFGAARRVISDRTQALTVILKPGYAPIEQYAEVPGLRQGPWTDVYALAGVAHFAITGAAPAPSIGRTIRDPQVPLEQAAAGRYSAAFLRAIDRALAVRPEDRPQSIAEFRALLDLDRTTSAASTEARTTVPPLPPKPRGVPAAAMVGGVLALGAAVAAGVFFYGNRPSASEPIATTPPTVAPTAPSPPAEPIAIASAPVPPTASSPPSALPEQPAVAATPSSAPASRVASAEKAIAPPQARPLRREPAPPPPKAALRERPSPGPIAVAPPQAREPTPAAPNPLAGMAAAALEDGEKCLRSKQYDCAIANANAALRAEPANQRARRLKGEAEEAQRRALSEIRIE